MSVAADFAGFGTDASSLRKKLRAAGAQVHDSFAVYGKDFRRRLGIESEQAMELFHQTVSMKSVGNLTEFVRDHMLEPFDADKWTAEIVMHFDDLTRAHEAVQRAQAQLTALNPLLEECTRCDRVEAEIAALTAQRKALRYYFADRKAAVLETLLASLAARRARLDARRGDLESQLTVLRDRVGTLLVELAGHGGNRLAEIGARIACACALVIIRGHLVLHSGTFGRVYSLGLMLVDRTIVILSPVVQPWYLIWALGLLACAPAMPGVLSSCWPRSPRSWACPEAGCCSAP